MLRNIRSGHQNQMSGNQAGGSGENGGWSARYGLGGMCKIPGSSRFRPVLGVFLLVGLLVPLLAAPPVVGTAVEKRQQAQKLMRDGNFRDAYTIMKELIMSPDSDPAAVADDLSQSVNCLQQLARTPEIDELLEAAVKLHDKKWQVLRRAANLYGHGIPKHGFIIAGKFERGDHRGGGEVAHATERDRVRALQLMVQAMPLAQRDDNKPQVGQFFNELAAMLLNQRGIYDAWRLQSLTNLQELPDVNRGWPGHTEYNGAPVDEAGQPIYFYMPKSWDAAKNDGERWRWALAQAVENDPSQRFAAQFTFAQFMEQMYGVQTMANWGYGHLFSAIDSDDDDDTKKNESGTYALHTLGEHETIAKLASGIKRFELPAEFNYLKLYRQLADIRENNGYGDAAFNSLAAVYANRRQFGKAAKCWEESIEKFGPGVNDYKREQLQQIVGNWGRFDNTQVQPAREGARLDFIFRNAKDVTFTAQAIKFDLLLGDVKAYLKSDPGQLDWNRLQIDNLGYRLVQQNEAKYLGEEVARWTLALEPRPDHFDRRITIATPLQKAGAYLVTAKLKDGNESKIVLWVADTAIVQKTLEGRVMYYVADAVSGQALPRLNVEFFGYRHESTGSNRFRTTIANFAEASSAEGIVTPDPRDLKTDFNWLVMVREGGRLAHLGFNGIWTGQRHDDAYHTVKVFGITDRPAYRPDQKVQFKFWVRTTQYDQDNAADFAGQSFPVEIHNPRGDKIFAQTLLADEYGGVSGELPLPVDAALGQYNITLQRGEGPHPFSGSVTFRVEEYKKPEFEVAVKAPTEPVMLGEKITAKIEAKYYFGSPVTEARVKYRITRVKHAETWYPRMPWDWCYSPGYWWFAYDYDWYPGWKQWRGCLRPTPLWYVRSPNDPPEVVAEVETEIGPTGSLAVEIDTLLAKELHANFDHEYTISAEITDASRRTITGSGKVLVARKPFRVFTWVDRGHYRKGDEIVARFQAQTLDHQGVAGTGTLRLLKIAYQDDQPVETEMQSWPIETKDDGAAMQKIIASAPGQYRLSLKLRDKAGHEMEGGYIFVVTGEGYDGRNFRFDAIELIPDKREYQPGEKVKLQITANRADATVLLFVRPANGVYLPPKFIQLRGKSTIEEIEVVKKDMPNFFVEALTVANGKVYTDAKEIVVPPEKRVLNVEVLPSATEYKPGEPAKVKVKLTDFNGENFVGSTVITVYDKAVEYISGGSNVPDIREFFWKWRREHHPQSPHNLQLWTQNMTLPKKPGMGPLGVFGDSVADESAALEQRRDGFSRTRRGLGRGLGGGGMQMLRKGQSMYFDASNAAPMAAMAAEPSGDFGADKQMAKSEKASAGLAFGGQGEGAAEAPVEPVVRTQFADTAFWKATLNTNAQGIAEVDFKMPENLGGWKIRVWGMGQGTRVGSGEADVVTRKNIMVRLQAPRFFVQKDEVVLSAIVHNYFDVAKDIDVQLEFTGDVLRAHTDQKVRVKVPAGGEQRVDWRCTVQQDGEATVRMKALTTGESDAMEMKFPAYVHGMLKQEAWAGTIRPDREKSLLTIRVPKERRVEQSVLEIRYSPTLAGAMVDALPYLADYPYGCTEQTLNRFLPSAITQKTLRQMDLDLNAIRNKRSNLNAQEIGDDRQRAAQWKRFDRNPVFEEAELDRMVRDGVKALTEMQCSDGGWGWFSGYGEHSWPHTTAVVVHGLQIAKENDVPLVPNMLEEGVAWLSRYQAEEIAKLKRREEKERKDDLPWKAKADDLDALVHMILTDAGQENADMRALLYRDRNDLSVYAKAMLGLALHKSGHKDELAMILKNIEQYVVDDAENETSWLRLPQNSYWWYWYGSEVEANAYYLKLLARTNAQGERAPRLVKYLLNNRKHGTYWNSTRDTALCVEAMAEYLRASGEMKPDMTVEVWIDGQKKQEAEISSDNLFTFNNRFVLSGAELTDGTHEIELRRRGKGAVYFNAYLTNFTLEDHIAKAGLEVKVERQLYLLRPVAKTAQVQGARGQVVDQKVEKYERIPLANLDSLTSGELVEVELVLESKNDYEYLILEDMKGAGFEAVEVRSGYNGNPLGAYVEFRDNRVVFLLRQLARGKHSVSYRLRAEVPGRFASLPARMAAMYAPELKGNSEEVKLVIEDAKPAAETKPASGNKPGNR